MIVFLDIFAPMLAGTVLPILVYTIRKCKSDWDIISFLIYNRYRILVSVVVDLVISSMMVYYPESINSLLTATGLPASVGAVGVGLFIGGNLVSVMGSSDLRDDSSRLESKYVEKDKKEIDK